MLFKNPFEDQSLGKVWTPGYKWTQKKAWILRKKMHVT